MVILANFLTLIISMLVARYFYLTLIRISPIYLWERLRGFILIGITILCFRFLNAGILEIVLTAQVN
jgi:hypothetical protein